MKKAIHAIDSKILYCDVLDKVSQIKVIGIKLEAVEAKLRTELPEGAHIAFKAAGVRPSNRILEYHKINSIGAIEEKAGGEQLELFV